MVTQSSLKQCEDARRAEADRCNELSIRLARLVEANCLLQAQLDATHNASATEQQVKKHQSCTYLIRN